MRFTPSGARGSALRAAIAACVAISSAALANGNHHESHRGILLFTQQDAVQAFDLISGQGHQVGTATGLISGTTSVEFQFAPAGPPTGDVLPITFHNKVILTDIDGDQIFFDNDGTGSFHLGVPGAPFQGSGGPLQGTYVVTGATGKFSDWEVGLTFTYSAIATNPPRPGSLGTVFAEVRVQRRDHRK